MGEFVFVGLGLADERQMTLRGLDEVKRADVVFAEFYTSPVPTDILPRLAALIQRQPVVLERAQLEEDGGRTVLEAAKTSKVVLLVPGDPLIATTHLSLRLAAFKQGISTRVANAPSILTAAIGASGLQNNRFGPSFTVPSTSATLPDSLYDLAKDNLVRGLHTLVFLDVGTEGKAPMTIKDAVRRLLKAEQSRRENVFRNDRLAVGLARLGYDQPIVKADLLESLMRCDFGDAPHCLVLPGRLHFVEAEALECFAGAPREALVKAAQKEDALRTSWETRTPQGF